jgi:hypothetical protein
MIALINKYKKKTKSKWIFITTHSMK